MRKAVSGRSWFCVLAIIALLLGVGTSARLDAQVVGGTLSGTVTDQTGGAVPNAAVAIKDNATGEIRDVTECNCRFRAVALSRIIIALTVSASMILATAVPAASWAPIPV